MTNSYTSPIRAMKKEILFTVFMASVIFYSFGINQASALTAEVKNHLGSPTIMIDGKPQTPLILWTYPPGRVPKTAQIDTQWKKQTLTFTAPLDDPGAAAIHIRVGQTTGTVWLDDVRFFEGEANARNPVNMVRHGDWEAPRPELDSAWVLLYATWKTDAAEKVSGKQSCRIEVTDTKNGPHMIYQGLKIQKGKRYTLTMWVKADRKRTVDILVIHHGPPWNTYSGLEDSIMWKQMHLANKAGVHLYSTELYMPWPKPGEKADFSGVDGMIEDMIAADPKILIMPRFYPMPPQWWIDAHPESVMVFDDKKIKEKYFSVASEAWLKDAIQHMRAFIGHIEAKYGDHVIAYQPACLQGGEWFQYQMENGLVYGGFEEPFRAGFAAFVKKKYQTEENLRKAWRQPQVTFATVHVPTAVERNNPALGLLYDPASQQFQADLNEYQSVAITDAITALAHAIKEETNRKKLSMFFYGYYFELGGLHQSGHMGLGRLLRSPDVDILCGPFSYSDRQPGGCIPMMSAVDSVRLAGKLWLNEDDTRTYLCSENKDPNCKDALLQKTPELTQRAHRRQFGHLLPRRLATWYMDLGNEGWMNGEDLWENIGQMKKIYDREMRRPAAWNPEVAVVVDERSTWYTQKWLPALNGGFRLEYYRMGTNFRILFLEDVLAGRAKLPKVTMFLNCLYLTPQDREKVKREIKGKTAVWFYGSGYLSNKGASAQNMTDLTGFSLKETASGPTTMRFESGAAMADGLTTMDYKNEDAAPRWSINPEPTIKPFARYADGSIAAASRDMEGGGRSLYLGTFGCPAKVVRNILKDAGVRIYVDSDDMLDTDGRFVSLTASSAGLKTILVPKGMNLFREGNATPLEVKNGQFTEPFDLGEARFYRLEGEKGQRAK